MQGKPKHTEECTPQKKFQTKTKRGVHRPDGSHLSPGRDQNLQSSVQGLLVRHAGLPRLAHVPHSCRQGDTSCVLGVVGKGSLAVSIWY
jgi:hypothetical protein